jgi:hypothetical protein
MTIAPKCDFRDKSNLLLAPVRYVNEERDVHHG